MSGGTHQLLFNSLGLRSGWRLLIYSILMYTLLAGKDLLVQKTMGGLDDISRYVVGHQLLRFAVCLLVSWVMSKIEGRAIAEQRTSCAGSPVGLEFFRPGMSTVLLVVLFLGIDRWFRDVKYLQDI